MRSTALALGLACCLLTAAPGQAQVRVGLQGDGGFVLGVTSWTEIPFRTVVRQQYDYSCGSAALATLLSFHYERQTSEPDAFKAMYAVGDQTKIRQLGFSLLDMKRYVESIGLKAEGYRLAPERLRTLDAPAIALIQAGRYRHFVVIKGVTGDQVLVGDPSLGLRKVPISEFAKMWNGVLFAVVGRQAHGFNSASDWNFRAGAPLAASLQPLSADVLTRELAPLYQISPLIVSDLGRP